MWGFGTVLTGVIGVSKGVKLAESDRNRPQTQVKPVGKANPVLVREAGVCCCLSSLSAPFCTFRRLGMGVRDRGEWENNGE